MNIKKIIVAGCRDFKGYAMLKKSLDALIVDPCEIVSGGASGVDTLAVIYASYRKFESKVFKADWDKHGKAAGPIRNREMAEYADELIAFWDGKSRGTKNMIETMRGLNKPVKVVLING